MSEPAPPGKELAVSHGGEHGSSTRDWSSLRDRLRRRWTPRSAAGAGLFATAVFLLPFAGWPWLPVAIGLGVLIVLRLLRLDGLMRGWAPHVAGAVVVALLLARTSPWVWALGLSLGIVVAGLLQLPRWRVLAVGAALLIVSGLGYGFTLNAAAAAAQLQRNNERQLRDSSYLVEDPGKIVRAVMVRIAARDSEKGCALLSAEAGEQLARSVNAADCQSAIIALASTVTDPARYSEPELPPGAVRVEGDHQFVDGCQASWQHGASAPGPRLGGFEMRLQTGLKNGYAAIGYRPCP